MPFTESRIEAVHSQLAKILSSAGFARNERLGAFLRFVIEQELSGKGDQLKESIVGVEVFGRRPDYDVRQDSVVRTEAGKLRARLAKYYAAEGAADPLVIELPKGGYAPAFRQHEAPEENSSLLSRLGTRLTGALAGLAVVSTVLGVWWIQHKRAPIPIAVLPLTNLSQDPANDYFADGLTGEIIRNLSIIDGLAVRSQTSSFVFKGKARNVRVRDDSALWSGRYDRELADVFAIQDEISRGIVNSLRLKLGRGRRLYETSVEAYDLYLLARALPIQRGFSGYDQSIGPLEKAIAKDPSFAPAYAGLAAAHGIRSGQFKFDLADEASKMRAAAEKAIQLDPLLAEAHDALGIAYARDGQWEPSETSFRRALEIDPSSSMSRGDFASYLLWPLGRIEEALDQLRVAEKTDSLSPWVQYELAYVLISAGRYDEAAGHCERLPEGSGPSKSECLGRARIGQGRIGEAIQILATDFNRGVSEGSPVRGYLGFAYARAGRREEAEKFAAATSSLNPFNRALIFAGLGDKDRTLEALDRATTAGPFRIGRALSYPELALIRGDPRVRALRKKVGLPE